MHLLAYAKKAIACVSSVASACITSLSVVASCSGVTHISACNTLIDICSLYNNKRKIKIIHSIAGFV